MDAAAAGRVAVQRRAPVVTEATTGGSPLFAPVADDSNKVLLEAIPPLQVGCLPACLCLLFAARYCQQPSTIASKAGQWDMARIPHRASKLALGAALLASTSRLLDPSAAC